MFLATGLGMNGEKFMDAYPTNTYAARATRRMLLARWHLLAATKRLGRAIRYATNRMTEDDANQIIYDCQPTSGWYPLETFSVENVLSGARDRWGDNPALPALAASACRRVWNKWDGRGYEADAAEDWALDLIAEYAEDDGVELVDQYEAETAE